MLIKFHWSFLLHQELFLEIQFLILTQTCKGIYGANLNSSARDQHIKKTTETKPESGFGLSTQGTVKNNSKNFQRKVFTREFGNFIFSLGSTWTISSNSMNVKETVVTMLAV